VKLSRSFLRRRLAGACTLLALAFGPALAESPTGSPFDPALFPPWQHGANNDALERGVTFTVPDADNLADFHGDVQDPKLVLYVGGNYFFAMAPLVQAFENRYPEFKGRLYWETLPPGILLKQIQSGGTITVGNLTWTQKADVYLAGFDAVEQSVKNGVLVAPAVAYASNTLTIMVAQGNPKGITGLADLQRADLKLAMPNPEFEGVARQIKASLAKSGGEALANAVYRDKVADGTSVLTQIHHRQTPLWIMQGRADAGVTWQSEAVFQEQQGHAIAHVAISEHDNTRAVYGGALVSGAPHPEAGRKWIEFITSPEAFSIFASYGFKQADAP